MSGVTKREVANLIKYKQREGMDWFFCITLSTLVLRHWWKHRAPSTPRARRATKASQKPVDAKALQRLEYEAQLRKQGYSDEIIAVILPTMDSQ